jgi:hypothetical protein
VFEAHRPAQHDGRKRAPTSPQGADAASHENSHQRPLKRQLASPGAGVAQEAQAHNIQPRLGASAAPAHSPQQTSTLPNYLQANNRLHLPESTAGTAATHDATGVQMATVPSPAQTFDHAIEVSAANLKKPSAVDPVRPEHDPGTTLKPDHKGAKHSEQASGKHGAKDASTRTTRDAAAASGMDGKAPAGKTPYATSRNSAPAAAAASKDAAASSAQLGETKAAGRAPVAANSKTAAPPNGAGGASSAAVGSTSSAGAASGGEAGGDASSGASPGAEAAMSAAGGTEAGGAAEAIQEKTEDKMAAANPQGAAEEAQAEGGGAESGAQGESETGAAEDAAAGDQAAGATESESAAPPQPEAEKSTTAASGSASTDPDAQQREQISQESREHQADSRRVAEGDSEEHAQDQTEQQADASAGASAPVDAEMSSGEKGAGLSDLSEEVAGGGEGAGGAVSGGGGAAAPAAAEDGPAPDTAAQDPADGLVSAASLSPVQAAVALTGISSAVNRTANEEAGALQEQIPSPEVGGEGASASAVQTLPGDSMTGKPAAVPAGSPVPTAAPAPLPAAGPAPSERVVTPSVSAGEGGTVAAEDATRVQGAVEDLPTHDPGLDVPVGAPPQVLLSGDADPAAADQQKAELDQTVTVQRAKGAADAAANAGENAIRVTRPKEIIKAPEIAKGRAGASMSAIDAGASEQGIGIIANEKKGPEVRAAMVKAQADMATKKGEHQEKVSQEKTRNDEKMAALKDENLAQQEAEKAGAKSEVAKARSDWTAEQRKTIAETNEKAGKEVAKGHEKVNQEQAQGNKQASDHLATGEKEASAAKVNAERDASAKKAEGKQESGGIFGWLSSKVTSFFNKIKNGITAIFDAAKKAVRWAIDKAKKAAVAAIELARKAIVSVIKAVGAALMALGDVLLAAFPSLRKRFRSFIESKVRAAENAVNRLADALKKGVTKLLDLLGKAFEFLLDAYKKGMLMVLDAAHAVVNGAIKFAKAVADLVGTFIVLIKDIAANPGGWIGNLGAAVMDGVKNHLWKAFKTAVSGWFNDKLEEVLGVGLTIWNVLKKGGISIKEVGKMAFEALKAAIPSALIQLLIEKVVAMIVPAAGAVMAIIEGLQAAWGTVQRIIAALGKFVSFLKAVKAGGAGPQFAELLAAAAIVVIDFVANWLLKKLRGPASKVGSKVKAIAQKIMAKVKAAMKKVGGALKKVAGKIGGVFKKGSKKLADWRAKRKAKKDAKKAGKKQDPSQKKKDKEARAKEKAQRGMDATRAEIDKLLARGTSRVMLGLRLKYLKWRWGWKKLGLRKTGGGKYEVEGRINPVLQISAHISFEISDHVLVSVRHEDVAKSSDLDAQLGRAHATPTKKLDKMDPAYDPSIDPAKFEKQALRVGVANRKGSGPVLNAITGPQPVHMAPGDAPVPSVQPGPDGVTRLGSRNIDVPGLPGRGGRKPDDVLEQHQGGQLVRSILCEVTVDSKLQQSHKKGGAQMLDTIARAKMAYDQNPNRHPNFEIVYLVLAKGSPGDMPSEQKSEIQAGLKRLAQDLPGTRVRVIWQWIPIG